MINGIPPAIIFLIVWLFDGTIIAWLMAAVGMKSVKAVGWAYAIAIVPAAITTLYGMN